MKGMILSRKLIIFIFIFLYTFISTASWAALDTRSQFMGQCGRDATCRNQLGSVIRELADDGASAANNIVRSRLTDTAGKTVKDYGSKTVSRIGGGSAGKIGFPSSAAAGATAAASKIKDSYCQLNPNSYICQPNPSPNNSDAPDFENLPEDDFCLSIHLHPKSDHNLMPSQQFRDYYKHALFVGPSHKGPGIFQIRRPDGGSIFFYKEYTNTCYEDNQAWDKVGSELKETMITSITSEENFSDFPIDVISPSSNFTDPFNISNQELINCQDCTINYQSNRPMIINIDGKIKISSNININLGKEEEEKEEQEEETSSSGSGKGGNGTNTGTAQNNEDENNEENHQEKETEDKNNEEDDRENNDDNEENNNDDNQEENCPSCQSPNLRSENPLTYLKNGLSKKFPFDLIGDFSQSSSSECLSIKVYSYQYKLCVINDIVKGIKYPVWFVYIINSLRYL